MRPHINIGTIGHVDHGKTTLTAAITASLADMNRSAPRRELLHVHDWLDMPAKDEGERLAKEWLEQFMKPHAKKDEAWLARHVLYCDYLGLQYICSGASTMGDVWIKKEGSNDFYDHRVDVQDLRNWKLETVVPPPENKPRRVSNVFALMAGAAMMGAGFGLPGGGPSGASIRNNPQREKTPEDLERMVAAQAKRERKANRKQ